MNTKVLILVLVLVMLTVNIATVVFPDAVIYDTAEQVVTVNFVPENYIRVSGDPKLLEIKKVGPEGMVSTNATRMDWSVDNKGDKKITAEMNDTYEGIELKVRIVSGVGTRTLSSSPMDVVTDLNGSFKVGQEIIYTATADASNPPPIGEQSRVVMFTLMDQ